MENPTKTPLHPDVPPGTTLKYSGSLHPVQKIERDFVALERATKRKLEAAAYGSALPMRKMMQENMLSQCQRLPGLPSSYAGLESLTGRDEKFDLEDFMNLPHESPEMPLEEPREQLERILGIRARSQTNQ